MNTNGIEVSHGAMVVDVEVTEKPLRSLPTILREPQALEVVKEASVAKIVNFSSIAKFEKKLSDAPQYEFFVEDNGQAKEITETIFTEDKYRERDSSKDYSTSTGGKMFAANDTARICGVPVSFVSRDGMPKGHEKSAGVWRNGKIYVCLENNPNAEEATKTVLQEAIGHMALPQNTTVLSEHCSAVPIFKRSEIASCLLKLR